LKRQHLPIEQKAIDTNLKLAACPARSVAAATFAFYLADPISSVHEFALIEASRMKIRENSCNWCLFFGM